MNKAILVVMACILVGVSSAALVTNGDFTENAAEWGSAGASYTADDTLGYAGLDVAAGGWGVWYQVGVENLDEWGIPVGTDVVIAADIKEITGTGGLDSASLKIEATTAGGGANGEYEDILPAVTYSWAPYSMVYPYTIPAGTASIKAIVVHKGFSTANYGFDNIEILVDGGTPALKPVPKVGGGAGTATTELSWVNPAGTTAVDVYLLESPTELTSPDIRTLVGTPTSVGTAESTAVTLVYGKYYYWVVDATVAAAVVPGFDWDFQTLDAPPIVDAGVDQYLEATASPMTISLDATVTEDNPGETYLWEDITVAADKDPGTVVAIVSDTAVDTDVTLTNTVNGAVSGWYQFRLTVTDSLSQVTIDEVTVGVYGTCAEAATADPADTYDSVGDLNSDCKKDLADFALFAAGWLDCDALRVTCP